MTPLSPRGIFQREKWQEAIYLMSLNFIFYFGLTILCLFCSERNENFFREVVLFDVELFGH